MRATLSTAALVLLTASAAAGEMNPATTPVESASPLSKITPREGGPDIGGISRDAQDLKDVLLVLSALVTEFRISSQAKLALRDALVRSKDILTETGATGVLVQGVYERSTDAERYSEDMPVKTTERLIGDRFEVIGAGASPKEVMALHFKKGAVLSNGPSDGKKVTDAPLDYWVSKDGKGQLAASKVDDAAVRDQARQLILDDAMSGVLERQAYVRALSDAIDAAERSRDRGALLEEAAKLREERDTALRQRRELQAALNERLATARKANHDAESLEIVQALSNTAAMAAASWSQSQRASEGSQARSNSGAISSSASEPTSVLIRKWESVNGQLNGLETKARDFLRVNHRDSYLPSSIGLP